LVSYFDKDFSRVDTQSREDHNNYFVEGWAKVALSGSR
jgi:hypothetical protein